MSEIKLPRNTELAKKMLDRQAESDQTRLSRGIVGYFFGVKDHVPNNVAAFVAVSAIALLAGVIAFANDTASLTRKDSAAIAVSLISLSVGFLFGRATKVD